MKLFKLIFLVLTAAFTFNSTAAQNALINIVTKNTGIVHKGGTVFLEVTINNTDPAAYIDVYKIRAKVSVPVAISSIAATGHVLPTGWTILSNDGSTINLSNGKDMIAANDFRVLLIAIKGNKIGGPSTVAGQLSFSDGMSPGSASGSLHGDNAADNFSTSTCQVIK